MSAPSPQALDGDDAMASRAGRTVAGRRTRDRERSAAYTATYTPQGGGGPAILHCPRRLAACLLAAGRVGGTTAADARGNGRAGSYLNTPSLGQPVRSRATRTRRSASTAPTSTCSVPYAAALNPATVTVEAWAYPTGGQGTFRSMVTSRDYAPGNARGYMLYASSAKHLAALARQRRLGRRSYGPPIVLNQWTHLVGTYDGTTARLYVNGALAASPGAGFLQNAVRPLRIATGTDKTAAAVLPARPSRRGRGLCRRALAGAGVGALRGRARRRWRQPAAERGRGRLTDERGGAPRRELLELGLQRSRRHDLRLRLGSRRRRRLRRLDRPEPLLHTTDSGTYTVRLRVTDNLGAQDVSDPITITRRQPAAAPATPPPSSPTRRLPTGAWARPRGRRPPMRPGNGRAGSYLNTPTLGQPGALSGDANTRGRLDMCTNEYGAGALRGAAQPGPPSRSRRGRS